MTDVTAIKARAEAATAGPWRAVGRTMNNGHERRLSILTENGDALHGNQLSGKAGTSIRMAEANADFIAHAREDVLALLAEVERLANERIAYKQGMDTCVEKADAALSLAQDLLRKSEDRGTAAEAALAEARAENERLREGLAHQLLAPYFGLMVLKTFLAKEGLKRGVATTDEAIATLVEIAPSLPALAVLRSAPVEPFDLTASRNAAEIKRDYEQ